MAAAATATKPAPATAPPPRPARRPARSPQRPAARPAKRAAAARKPATRKPAARRRAPASPPGGNLIPLAVGRTAVVVRGLPDSGLVVRLTRSRAWIALLGTLLAGIVALNVATLSMTASAGTIAEQTQTLKQENTTLQARLAKLLSSERIANEAARVGLVVPSTADYTYRKAAPDATEAMIRRFAAAAESG